MNIFEPKNLFKSLFAVIGDKTIIPTDNDKTSGKASLQSGFPYVTQLPVSQGGVAPDRKDFNGILYMLSAFAFFNQSGGIFTYKAELDYHSPAIISYNGNLWYCVKSNGTGTANGVKVPGTDEDYWKNFAQYIYTSMKDVGIKLDGGVVGDIKMHYGTVAPEGWFFCNGSVFDAGKYPQLFTKLGSDRLPDFRGLVPRGYDPTSINDPDGANRTIGDKQADAGRNITGGISGGCAEEGSVAYGAFRLSSLFRGAPAPNTDYGFTFDASRVWGADHTANEFRMKNFTILFCIKHD